MYARSRRSHLVVSWWSFTDLFVTFLQCPFHGKIIPRDENGCPSNPADIKEEPKETVATVTPDSTGTWSKSQMVFLYWWYIETEGILITVRFTQNLFGYWWPYALHKIYLNFEGSNLPSVECVQAFTAVKTCMYLKEMMEPVLCTGRKLTSVKSIQHIITKQRRKNPFLNRL